VFARRSARVAGRRPRRLIRDGGIIAAIVEWCSRNVRMRLGTTPLQCPPDVEEHGMGFSVRDRERPSALGEAMFAGCSWWCEIFRLLAARVRHLAF
jgi:hypothetical protein